MEKASSKGASKFQKNTKINRIFSEAFKREKVQLIMQKQLTIKQCCDVCGIRRTTVYNWLHRYSPDYGKGSKMVVELESEAAQSLVLRERVSELERVIG
jgi:transposase-like protein